MEHVYEFITCDTTKMTKEEFAAGVRHNAEQLKLAMQKGEALGVLMMFAIGGKKG